MTLGFKGETIQGRGEYNVLFGDKGKGRVFGFSANFGNVLGGAKRPPKYFQKMIKHFRKIFLTKKLKISKNGDKPKIFFKQKI